MPPCNHIIHRLNLEIEAPDEKTAAKVKDDIPELLKNYIIPDLEKYLDSQEETDESIRVEKINIDIGNLRADEVEDEFEPRVIRAAKEVVEKIIVNKSGKQFTINYPSQLFSNNNGETNEIAVEKFSHEERTIEAFLYFLETGRLPWWISLKTGALSEESLLYILNAHSFQFRERMIRKLQEYEPATERLLRQFSSPFLIKIIAACVSAATENRTQTTGKEIEEEIIRVLKLFQAEPELVPLPFPPDELQLAFFRKIIQELIAARGKTIRKSRIKEIFIELKALAVIKKTAHTGLIDEGKSGDSLPVREDQPPLAGSPELDDIKAIKAETGSPVDKVLPEKPHKGEEDGIFVQNAGLVLLHPFLQYFFKDFDLLENDIFKNEKAQILAVHLLHYLATGRERPPEYELVFEKYLCGLKPDQPVDRFIKLDQRMKDESEVLLKAVIGHWKQLKHTSPDGLREGFLEREGKLIMNGFQDRLILENKSFDVLLNYLPWGYSVVKLPWMQEALHVDWSY